MSKSIHETWNQLRKENRTIGEVNNLAKDDETLLQLRKKRQIKKDALDKRKLNKISSKL